MQLKQSVKKNWISFIKQIVKPFFILVSLGIIIYLLRFIFLSWQEIKANITNARIEYLFAGLLFYTLAQILVAILWRIITAQNLKNLDFFDTIGIFFLSALGRYLPGKVWQLVGLAYLSKNLGVSEEIAIGGAIFSQLLAILSGIVLSGPGLYKLIPFKFLLPFLLFALLFLYPGILQKLIELIARKLRGDEVKYHLKFSREIIAFAGYGIAWGLYGTGFSMILKSFGLKFSLFRSVSLFTTSYLTGLFALFVPGGIGIREGMLVYLLHGTGVERSLASLIALVSRLLLTLTEILLAFPGIYVIVRKKH